MPKTKIDYSKTIIYKIINYDFPDLLYVGSTTNFTKRKQNHKERCSNVVNKSHDYKIYKTIRENGEWESWNMIKICDYPCNNKREAEQEEDRYMMELKANMNMRRAFQTRKQYREENKDKIHDKKKQYYEDNKENIKENRRQYYEDNIDKIRENKSKIYTCECGSSFRQDHKSQHIKTIKHQKYLNTIE
jgi:hypothetical protein